MSIDSTVRFALDNLDRMLREVEAGKRGTDALRIAAEQVLRVTSPAAIEDREYHTIDLALPISEQCGHHGPYGRVCDRRANHVSPDHREAEVSWKGEDK